MRFLYVFAAMIMLPQSGVAQTVVPGARAVHDAEQTAASMKPFFSNLRRPDSPNHCLVAPAGFAVKPDVLAPVFGVPAAKLHLVMKALVQQTKGTSIATETADGLHIIVTSRVFGFKDDVRIHIVPLSPQESTLLMYSSSRVGYWDLGVNRRRTEDWLARLQTAVSASGQ